MRIKHIMQNKPVRTLVMEIQGVTNSYTAQEFEKIFGDTGLARSRALGDYFISGLTPELKSCVYMIQLAQDKDFYEKVLGITMFKGRNKVTFGPFNLPLKYTIKDDEVIARALQFFNGLGKDFQFLIKPNMTKDNIAILFNNHKALVGKIVLVSDSTVNKWKLAVQAVDDYKAGRTVSPATIKVVQDIVNLPDEW